MKARTKFHAVLSATVISQVAVKCMLIAVTASTFRCAPLSSDLQSARLVGKKGIEITPGYSSVQFTEEKKQVAEKQPQESTGKLIGLQVAYGLSDKVDIRVRAEHFEYRNFSTNVFSIGPKISLVKDRVALYLPVWFVDFKPAQCQPTLLLTFPVLKNRIEFNPSVKNIISLGGYDPNCSFLFAFNTGLGISTDLSKWALRPEYSLVYDVKQSAQYRSFSIGLSLNLSLLIEH
ncbi:MAG: hypothetical protein SH819_13495 [Cytophagales bacterium]|nr:hypothetical protein [Cytophagales bacterium]